MLGHEYLIVPSFTADTERSLDDWREWADRFNAAGALARRAGVWLAFHNEPLAAIPDLAKKPCYVEQENARDELASARTDFEYLRNLEF